MSLDIRSRISIGELETDDAFDAGLLIPADEAQPGTFESGLDAARRLILEALNGSRFYDTPGYCRISYACGQRIPREIGRAILKHMRDEGLVQYGRGLFTEDGEVFGSGYCITPKGEQWLKERTST